MLDVLTFGSLTLHSAVSVIPHGVAKASGLVGVPDVRGNTTDRPEGHGAIEPARQFLKERLIVIEGELYASTVSSVWAIFDTLSGILVDGLDAPQTLTWRRFGGSVNFTANVRTAGSVLPDLEDGMSVFPYQLHLRQADPAAYDVTSRLVVASAPTASGGMPFPMVFPIPFGAGVSGGNVAVTNAGNFKTWPVLTLTGPVNGPVIGNSTRGEWITFENLTLAAGESLIVNTDPQSRTATVGGVDVMGTLRLIDANFPAISRNSVEQFQFYGLGGGYTVSTTLSVASRDAYIS